MNNNYYISNDDYYIIRNGLLDDNNDVMKTSIQSLITQLEENKLLNNTCTKDLCAILYKIVQNPDYKIRKWAYHLIAYKNTPKLVSRCIENLQDGTESDSENITWIIAIASMSMEQEELFVLYKQYAAHKINKLEYQLCTTIFSNYGVNITQRDIRKIIGKEDFLAKMWLTKIYACIYKETKKKQYVKVVNRKIMNELLQEEKLNRYALWAFSTFERVNLRKIDIKPYNAINLQAKSLAWYYNCMFKDEQYVYRNRDHIGAILDDFFILPTVVQGGILRGLERIQYNLGYMENRLVRIYFQLDDENLKHVSLIISLTQIFLKHVNESNELKKILMDKKMDTKIDAVKRILFFYNNNEKEKSDMARTININGQVQYNEKPEKVIQVNSCEKIVDSRVIEITKQIKDISEKLQEGCYDDILDTQSVELENMITNFEFDLNYGKGIEGIKESSQINERLNELEASVEELKKGKITERKAKFSNVLTKLSEICTTIVAVPQLIDITQRILGHIRIFLHI